MNALGAVGEALVELTVGEDTAQLSFGGDVANICVMAAHVGVRSRLAGRVGTDALGDRLLAFFERQGVDVGAVRRDPTAPTGMYINERAQNAGHRFTYWRAGSAGSRLEPGDLHASFFDDLAVLVVSGVTLAVSSSCAAAAEFGIREARTRGLKVACILNYRPALGGDIDRLAATARAADIVVASSEDVATVFGKLEPAAFVSALGPGPSEVILTDGECPVSVSFDGDLSSQPVPQVPIENAAGAGDALAGAYLGRRLLGDSPALSLRWGIAAASLSVQRAGCADSYPTGDEVAAMVGEMSTLGSSSLDRSS